MGGGVSGRGAGLARLGTRHAVEYPPRERHECPARWAALWASGIMAETGEPTTLRSSDEQFTARAAGLLAERQRARPSVALARVATR